MVLVIKIEVKLKLEGRKKLLFSIIALAKIPVCILNSLSPMTKKKKSVIK